MAAALRLIGTRCSVLVMKEFAWCTNHRTPLAHVAYRGMEWAVCTVCGRAGPHDAVVRESAGLPFCFPQEDLTELRRLMRAA
jgi:hypothetical protein